MHGASLADTAGAIMKSALWRWTYEKLTAIADAATAVRAANAQRVKGHVALLTWHDITQ